MNNQSPLKLTLSLITAQETIKDLLNLPEVEHQWVMIYKKVTGLDDGARRYEMEKMMFLQQASGTALEKCEKFSIYAAFVELASSGLTLRDGLAYIIPYGKKASFEPGWKGRIEQINQMQDVIHCPEPMLIRQGDPHKIKAGEKLIIEHEPLLNSKGEILAVYLPILMHHGVEFYMMTRDEILAIRDAYSESYKSYIKALEKPVNKGKKAGDKLTIEYRKDGQIKIFESDDVPMWIGNEAQAFKKTLVKRTYNALPKMPHQKYLDERIAERISAAKISIDDIDDNSDPIRAIDSALRIAEIESAAQPIDAPGNPANIASVLAPVTPPAQAAAAQPEPIVPAPEQIAPGNTPNQPQPQNEAPETNLFKDLGAGL